MADSVVLIQVEVTGGDAALKEAARLVREGAAEEDVVFTVTEVVTDMKWRAQLRLAARLFREGDHRPHGKWKRAHAAEGCRRR